MIFPLKPEIYVNLACPLMFELEAAGGGPNSEGFSQYFVHLVTAHPAGIPAVTLAHVAGYKITTV